jgi:hypothetical protein
MVLLLLVIPRKLESSFSLSFCRKALPAKTGFQLALE